MKLLIYLIFMFPALVLAQPETKDTLMNPAVILEKKIKPFVGSVSLGLTVTQSTNIIKLSTFGFRLGLIGINAGWNDEEIVVNDIQNISKVLDQKSFIDAQVFYDISRLAFFVSAGLQWCTITTNKNKSYQGIHNLSGFNYGAGMQYSVIYGLTVGAFWSAAQQFGVQLGYTFGK